MNYFLINLMIFSLLFFTFN